jgi:holliday junction DNA helicase RuvA
VTFLMKLPGIGKKTAQRMILDLKDKLSSTEGMWTAATIAEQALPAEVGGNSSWAAAREALGGLGYREAELDRAWHTMKDKVTGGESPDALLKLALQQLFQG